MLQIFRFRTYRFKMATLPLAVLWVCSLLAFSGPGDAAKILLLLPSSGSHYMNFAQIARALVARDHTVHAYLNHGCKRANEMSDIGVKIHLYHSSCLFEDKEIMKKQMDMFLRGASFLEFINSFKVISDGLSEEIHAIFTTKSSIDDLKAVGFDLCIIDGIFLTSFYHILPYKLDIPTVSLLAIFEPLIAGVPGLPSFTPYINFGMYSNRMTFMERVLNTLMTTLVDTFVTYVNPGSSANLVAKYAPEKPFISLTALRKRARMWLVMSNVAIDYPQVRMPHIVDVGGINTGPPNPLVYDLQKIADEAKEGLIVVSFGTYITEFPDAITKKMFEAFRKLKQTVLMRLTKVPGDVPSNVHIRRWIPQNDILAHHNTALLITHCGANSQFEALYHGVPLLGFPIFGDQFYNALRISKKGLGLQLDLLKSTPEDIVASVNEILTNKSFSKTMALHSALFRDQPQTPMRRLTHSIEQLTKYGSDHLYNEGVNLPWYSYWCLDVAVFLFLVIIAAVLLLFIIIRSIYRCACRSKKHKMKMQ